MFGSGVKINAEDHLFNFFPLLMGLDIVGSRLKLVNQPGEFSFSSFSYSLDERFNRFQHRNYLLAAKPLHRFRECPVSKRLGSFDTIYRNRE